MCRDTVSPWLLVRTKYGDTQESLRFELAEMSVCDRTSCAARSQPLVVLKGRWIPGKSDASVVQTLPVTSEFSGGLVNVDVLHGPDRTVGRQAQDYSLLALPEGRLALCSRRL